MTLLTAHMDAVEGQLLATSRIPANSGHSLHKGTPREAFIRGYLEGHLSQNVAIGTGEIIDASSEPNQQRNQIDIVIYRRDYPRLDFGGGVNAFLAESVIATIEVKSTLDQDEMRKSVKSASNTKALKKSIVRSFTTGYQPPSILSYVVAYDGPAKMNTVYGWVKPIHDELGIQIPALGETMAERQNVPGPSVDGVFVLGRGFMHFDNFPLGFIEDQARIANPGNRWVIGDCATGSLLLLFLFLTAASSGVSASWLDPNPYVRNVGMPAGSLSLGR